MIYDFSKTSTIVNQFVKELRSETIQLQREKFRNNLKKIGSIMAYEISKSLSYTPVKVPTPLGEATVNIPKDKIVLSTILRAGIPLHDGFLNIFENAENAFVSSYRQHHKDGTFDIKISYITSPSIEGKVLILCDTMLATGSSIEIALNELLKLGKPKFVHIVSVIASTEGVKRLRRLFPKYKLWICAQDEELTAKSYIVPGLGDAGDLAYGPKSQN